MRKFQVDARIRTLQTNLDLFRLLCVFALDANGNLLRITAYDAEVSLVQMQTEARTAGQVRFKFLLLEIRGLLGALAESQGRKQNGNGQEPKRVIHKHSPANGTRE